MSETGTYRDKSALRLDQIMSADRRISSENDEKFPQMTIKDEK